LKKYKNLFFKSLSHPAIWDTIRILVKSTMKKSVFNR